MASYKIDFDRKTKNCCTNLTRDIVTYQKYTLLTNYLARLYVSIFRGAHRRNHLSALMLPLRYKAQEHLIGNIA